MKKKDKETEKTKRKILVKKIPNKKVVLESKDEKKEKEDEGLEEILIEEPDFSEFEMQEIGFRAPVLSQMAEAPRNAGMQLEAGVASSQKAKTDNEDAFSYRVASEDGEDRKYDSHSETYHVSGQVDISNAGRTRQSFVPQEVAFTPSEQTKRDDFASGETYVPVERTDIESAGRTRKTGFDNIGKVKREYEVK